MMNRDLRRKWGLDIPERVAGFMAHLRRNGFAVGPGETEMVLTVFAATGFTSVVCAKLGMKTMLSGDRGQWERFDELFDAYWFRRGIKTAIRTDITENRRNDHRRPVIWDAMRQASEPAQAIGSVERVVDDGREDRAVNGAGRIAAARREAKEKVDLRTLVDPEDIALAERVAEQLARAIRYRLSRRRVPTRHGDTLDLRRTIRRNLSRGAEPLELLHRHRPDRPVNIVVLLDVSGSMKSYSRYFLSFVRGLVGRWLRAEAFLFHTRLVRITDVLRDNHLARAMDRLSLMVEGFGGGTKIASSLKTFNDRYAHEVLNSRSVVILMSDGYDTEPPEALEHELVRLKRRARRLVWLNPLIGWRDYAPVARAMAAALCYVDCFAAAHSLESLAALEREFARL